MNLALIGSRAPGFHHDVASKLQSLMMSVDEIGELAQNDEQIRRAAETALEALRQVLALLNVNRALTKPPARTAVALREILDRASSRVYVSLVGTLIDATLHVAAPSTIHALALAFDVAAGPGRGRSLAATARVDGSHVELRLGCSPSSPAEAPESIAIASFVLGRDGGSLHCTADGAHLVLRLPLSAT
jgi:hypothetical protein